MTTDFNNKENLVKRVEYLEEVVEDSYYKNRFLNDFKREVFNYTDLEEDRLNTYDVESIVTVDIEDVDSEQIKILMSRLSRRTYTYNFKLHEQDSLVVEYTDEYIEDEFLNNDY